MRGGRFNEGGMTMTANETVRQNAAGLWEKRRQRGTVHGKKQRDAATEEKH